MRSNWHRPNLGRSPAESVRPNERVHLRERWSEPFPELLASAAGPVLATPDKTRDEFGEGPLLVPRAVLVIDKLVPVGVTTAVSNAPAKRPVI